MGNLPEFFLTEESKDKGIHKLFLCLFAGHIDAVVFIRSINFIQGRSDLFRRCYRHRRFLRFSMGSSILLRHRLCYLTFSDFPLTVVHGRIPSASNPIECSVNSSVNNNGQCLFNAVHNQLLIPRQILISSRSFFYFNNFSADNDLRLWRDNLGRVFIDHFQIISNSGIGSEATCLLHSRNLFLQTSSTSVTLISSKLYAPTGYSLI